MRAGGSRVQGRSGHTFDGSFWSRVTLCDELEYLTSREGVCLVSSKALAALFCVRY